MVSSQDLSRCQIERGGYALCHRANKTCVKTSNRYGSLLIYMTYMSIATLYVGHLILFNLLECVTISSRTMASKYAHGLLFYRFVACRGPTGRGIRIRQETSPRFRNSESVHPSRPPLLTLPLCCLFLFLLDYPNIFSVHGG
jgi:hypothetical protein